MWDKIAFSFSLWIWMRERVGHNVVLVVIATTNAVREESRLKSREFAGLIFGFCFEISFYAVYLHVAARCVAATILQVYR